MDLKDIPAKELFENYSVSTVLESLGHSETERKIDQLVIEVMELREDKTRLDWLDEHEAAIEVHDEEVITCRVQASDDFKKHGFSDPYSVREAIDAARNS